jgi:hypothetical protein
MIRRFLFQAGLAATALVLLTSCATTVPVYNGYFGPDKPATEVAAVTIPWEVQIRAINGERPPLLLSAGRAREYRLNIVAGPQEWIVCYYDPFAQEHAGWDQWIDRTKPVPLRFTVQAGRSYRLLFETAVQSPALRKAGQQVRFWVADEAGAVVPEPPAKVPATAPAVPPNVTTAPTPSSTETTAPVALEKATLDQLKNWWRIAGPEERKAFLEWTHEQP